MTIAPYTNDPESVRPVFRQLRLLADRIRDERIDGVSMDTLSMGMSGDFEVAIQEGSTMVRIGSLLFGPRSNAEYERRHPGSDTASWALT